MSDDDKRFLWKDGQWKYTLIVGTLFASIPFGFVVSFVMNDARWFWLCLPIFIFLS